MTSDSDLLELRVYLVNGVVDGDQVFLTRGTETPGTWQAGVGYIGEHNARIGVREIQVCKYFRKQSLTFQALLVYIKFKVLYTSSVEVSNQCLFMFHT